MTLWIGVIRGSAGDRSQTTYQYGAWRAVIHTLFAKKGAYIQFLFGVLFHPAQISVTVDSIAQ